MISQLGIYWAHIRIKLLHIETSYFHNLGYLGLRNLMTFFKIELVIHWQKF